MIQKISSPFRLLLELKFTLLKNSFRSLFKRSKIELATLIFFFTAAAGGLFYFFFRSFLFFKTQEPFGPILLDETFYLFNFAIFVMLLISSGVSAYSSLFRSREAPFLITRPVNWPDIYFIKLTEALWYSSWSLLFITIPFMTAYGLVKDTDVIFFPVLCFLFYIPFVFLAGTLGTLAAVLTVWYLPSRGRRRFAMLILCILAFVWYKHAQPALIDQPQTRRKARLAQAAQHARHLVAAQHKRQRLRAANLDFGKHRPVVAVQTLAEKAAQTGPRQIHRAAAVMLVLAQEQEVLAQLVLGERGRVTLKVLGQLDEVADVFLLGLGPVVFEFDNRLELLDTWIREEWFHSGGRMPARA